MCVILFPKKQILIYVNLHCPSVDGQALRIKTKIKMKTLKLFIVAIIALAVSATATAQMTDHSKMSAPKTEIIKVGGNCESCKARIEKAAKIEGVAKADWNEKTKLLTLVYDPSKVRSIDVQKKIADVGHDTPKFRAEAKVYNALPSCCKYR